MCRNNALSPAVYKCINSTSELFTGRSYNDDCGFGTWLNDLLRIKRFFTIRMAFHYRKCSFRFVSFSDWKTFANREKLKIDDNTDFRVSDMCTSVFEKREVCKGVFYVYNDAVNFEPLRVSLRNFETWVFQKEPQQLYLERLPISTVKYNDLNGLCLKSFRIIFFV